VKAKNLGACVVAAVALFVASPSSAACIVTKSAIPEKDAARPGVLGLSLEDLIHGMKARKRETSPDDAGGLFTEVTFTHSMSIIAEGDETNLSRFSISMGWSPDEDDTQKAAATAMFIVARAFGARTQEDIQRAGAWFVTVLDAMTQQFVSTGRNWVVSEYDKDRFHITVAGMRVPDAVLLCFEPRGN